MSDHIAKVKVRPLALGCPAEELCLYYSCIEAGIELHQNCRQCYVLDFSLLPGCTGFLQQGLLEASSKAVSGVYGLAVEGG